MMTSIDYISSKTRNDYQKDNFDDFLASIKFSFNIPAIHVAGTNGKGSTCTLLKDIYIANGYKVGLFTSPDKATEMIKINDVSIPVLFIDSVIKEYKKQIEKYDLSTFEILTFVALKWFMSEKVDIAIIECGMGGAFDATNIFTPILSIITTISIEHSDYLGQSLSEIALHKAGIIKENIPVLIGNLEGDALTTVVQKCKETDSTLTILDHTHNVTRINNGLSFDYRPYLGLYISNLAEYRVSDACLAVEATNLLGEQFPVKEDLLKEGLRVSKLKCRFEVIEGNPTIILDGAHNPEGIESLRKAIDKTFYGRTIHVVFAAFRDKNIAQMLPEISLIGKITLTTFHHVRARTEEDYFLYLEDYAFEESFESLIDRLIEENKDDVILVTGSLAFTYVVREYLIMKGIIRD